MEDEGRSYLRRSSRLVYKYLMNSRNTTVLLTESNVNNVDKVPSAVKKGWKVSLCLGLVN